MDVSGIYKIANRETSKVYIGSAVDIPRRWRGHKRDLSRGMARGQKLQRAWDKYGAEAFEFSVLLYCRKEDLILFEQRAIDSFDAVRSGFNTAPIAGSQLGFRHSAATRTRLSESLRGNKRLLGHVHSAETRAKLSAAGKGKKKAPRTPEHLANMSASRKGTVPTPTARVNMAAAQLGKTHSEETKAKMSLSAKKWRQEKRQAAATGGEAQYGFHF
jgi:group I intron endonuclease